MAMKAAGRWALLLARKLLLPLLGEVNVDEFGSLKPLRASGLGLGEWVALGALAKGEGLTGKPLGRNSLPLS